MLFYALTAPGHTVDEVALALRKEIERLKKVPVSQQELEREDTGTAGLLRSFKSNGWLSCWSTRLKLALGAILFKLEAIAGDQLIFSGWLKERLRLGIGRWACCQGGSWEDDKGT